MPTSIADRQRPPLGNLFLDHIAYAMPDLVAAARALRDLGFALTLGFTGGGRVMLEEGYIEFVASQGQAHRNTGPARIAFGVPRVADEHARLARHGFVPPPSEVLEVEVETALETRRIRSTPAHVLPLTMPEGDVSFVQHLAPEGLWEPRWLAHDNGVIALAAAFVVDDDPPAAAVRYARLCGLLPRPAGPWVRLLAARGELVIGTRAAWHALLGAAPLAPAFAGCALTCRDAHAFAERCARAGVDAHATGDGLYAAQLPAGLGGAWLFGERAAIKRWSAAP